MVLFLMVLLLHAIQEEFEGLNLAWDCEGTSMVKPKLFCSLFQQHFEQRVAKVAGGYDEPPKLGPT